MDVLQSLCTRALVRGRIHAFSRSVTLSDASRLIKRAVFSFREECFKHGLAGSVMWVGGLSLRAS